MSSCENPIPCERARPLDQANSRTCVLHAIANAVADACMDQNLDLKLDELVGALKQLDFRVCHFYTFLSKQKGWAVFFVGDSVLMVEQFLKTMLDKGKMVRFHFSGS